MHRCRKNVVKCMYLSRRLLLLGLGLCVVCVVYMMLRCEVVHAIRQPFKPPTTHKNHHPTTNTTHHPPHPPRPRRPPPPSWPASSWRRRGPCPSSPWAPRRKPSSWAWASLCVGRGGYVGYVVSCFVVGQSVSQSATRQAPRTTCTNTTHACTYVQHDTTRNTNIHIPLPSSSSSSSPSPSSSTLIGALAGEGAAAALGLGLAGYLVWIAYLYGVVRGEGSGMGMWWCVHTYIHTHTSMYTHGQTL